ncbi:hypothetical protein HDV06_002395 [Boothiomyces sp. JEL0866]|nr:hypothetical protein HDV06_002395 [Boothiomyces sp. JEL0866]
MTEQEQQEFYELPPFSLTYEGNKFDLFNSLSDSNVLLFGEDYVPQTIDIPISSDEELYSSVLYESAIIYLVLELKSMLGIVNTDVIVKFPQLDLEIHEDISVLKKLTCNDVYHYWVKLAHSQGISESEMEPLQIVLQKHNNCIKDRITFLHYLGEKGSDVANPILVEDSEVELHYSDDSVDSVDDLSGDHDDLTTEKIEKVVEIIDVVEKDQLAEELITEENEIADDLIYDDGETLASGTETHKVDKALVKAKDVDQAESANPIALPNVELSTQSNNTNIVVTTDNAENDLVGGKVSDLENINTEKRELELTTEVSNKRIKV